MKALNESTVYEAPKKKAFLVAELEKELQTANTILNIFKKTSDNPEDDTTTTSLEAS